MQHRRTERSTGQQAHRRALVPRHGGWAGGGGRRNSCMPEASATAAVSGLGPGAVLHISMRRRNIVASMLARWLRWVPLFTVRVLPRTRCLLGGCCRAGSTPSCRPPLSSKLSPQRVPLMLCNSMQQYCNNAAAADRAERRVTHQCTLSVHSIQWRASACERCARFAAL